MNARLCVVCETEFTPKHRHQRACQFRCARTLAGRTLKQRPNAFANANLTRRAAAKRAVETLCRKRWPELSVREIEIFNFACAVGYQRGYCRAYHRVARSPKIHP